MIENSYWSQNTDWYLVFYAESFFLLQGIIVFQSVGYEDPDGPYDQGDIALGWLVVTFVLMWIPIMAIVEVVFATKKTGVRIFAGSLES